MPPITVVARIKARPDAIEKVGEALLKLVALTLKKDDGCISYDLHQDSEDPTIFFFLEKWKSAEHLNSHLDSPHVKNYRKATEGVIAQRDMNRLIKIS